jgi:hypothetical protein
MSGLVLGYLVDPRLPITTGTTVKNPLPFMPTLARDFRSSDTLRLYFEIVTGPYNRTNVARVTVELIDATGRTVRSWRPTPTPGQRTLVDLPLPLEGLVPGAYTLRVAVVGGNRVSRELTVSVRRPNPQ